MSNSSKLNKQNKHINIRTLKKNYVKPKQNYVITKYAEKTARNMKKNNCGEYSVKNPDDGRKVCPKHVEFFIKIKLRNNATCWLLL